MMKILILAAIALLVGCSSEGVSSTGGGAQVTIEIDNGQDVCDGDSSCDTEGVPVQ